MEYSTNFQTNGQSLLLNAITGVNCIQSVFPQCKLQQSKVTNKTFTGTKTILKLIILTKDKVVQKGTLL